jgi:hypothetical protein
MAAAMAPIAVKNIDGPGVQEISKRLNQTLPPQLQGDKEDEQIPPQVKQQLEQAEQMIEQLTQRVQQLDGAIQMDEVKAQKELARTRESDETKERIARIQAEATISGNRSDLIKELLKIDAEGSKALAQEETKRLLKLADLEVASQMPPSKPAPQSPRAQGSPTSPQGTPQRPPMR